MENDTNDNLNKENIENKVELNSNEEDHIQVNEISEPTSIIDYGPVDNVKLTKPVFVKKKLNIDRNMALKIIPINPSVLKKHLESFSDLFENNSSDINTLKENLEAATDLFYSNTALDNRLNSKNTNWTQSVSSGDRQLMAAPPRINLNYSDQVLEGDMAAVAFQRATSNGSPIVIPLWHTGIWITIKTPTTDSLLELWERISQEKIRLGRDTNGLIFSNTSVYIKSYLINFILAHTTSATYQYQKVEELKNIILVTDLEILIWALAFSIYPAGYYYEQPCLNDPRKCKNVINDTINLGYLCWVNEREISEKQRSHMSKITSKFTLEEIQKYQEEFNFNKNKTIQINSGLSFELRIPTLNDYETSGFTWINETIAKVDQAFANGLTENERNVQIDRLSKVTAFREYSHWIEKIHLTEYNGTIEKREDIEKNISSIPPNDSIYKNYYEGLQEYISNCSIAVIAVPRVNCPVCGSPMTEEQKTHPHLTAIDPTQLFFTLRDQRILKIISLAQ